MDTIINFLKKIIKSHILFIKIFLNLKNFLLINIEKEYNIVKFIHPSPVIFDIGGHIGESINAFLKKNPNSYIHSFEANKDLYLKMRKELKFRINNSRYKIYNYLISNKKKNFLYIPSALDFKFTELSSVEKKYVKQRFKSHFPKILDIKLKKTPVKSLQIDKFYKYKPNVLKIDTEGSELNVLLSGKRIIKYLKPLLIIEYNSSNYTKIKLFLKKYHYHPFVYKRKNLFYKMNKNIFAQIKNSSHAKNICFINENNPINKIVVY